MAENCLKVTIVGGGLAGLLAARVLREQHDVTVIERASGNHETGAALNLAPSAVKILSKLGFSKENAGSITADTGRTFTRGGKLISSNDMSNFARMGGADWCFQHRADLWNEFARLATTPSEELGISGQPAKLSWNTDVTNVDVETGDVTLADGTKISSDLVIAADGIKSVVRPLVVGEEAFRTARPSGSSAFRLTIPTQIAREVYPNDRLYDRTKNAVLDIHLAQDATNRSVVMYCCRNFELLNLVCIAPDSCIKSTTEESWSATGTTEDLLDTFHDFSLLNPLLAKAENVKLWQLRDQDPLPSYIKGRTVLMGDAAHAMTPHQGQGATQAVEDAEAFSLFNVPTISRDNVSSILQDFDIVRRTRASQIQKNTREAHVRKTPETVYKHTKYNWCYPGVWECLKNMKAGNVMMEV